MKPNEENCLKKTLNSNKLNRVLFFSKDYRFDDFKKRCKELKCTVNEGLWTMIGLGVKKYAVVKNDHKLKSISVTQTYATIPLPRNMSEV